MQKFEIFLTYRCQVVPKFDILVSCLQQAVSKFDNCSCSGNVSDVDGLGISQSGHNAVLTWTDTGATEYKVYRSTVPYFTPDDATNLLATVTTATFTDSGAVGSAATNYFYKVRGVDACPPANPNYIQRVGEFDFNLVAGTN